MMKKRVTAVLAALTIFAGCSAQPASSAAAGPLPAPEKESGIRGEQFGIDKNINESTIDQYLGREDTVYRDMRMLKDEADYEAIGGDSYLSGLVEGFEVVPYPYLCNVEGLPAEVGSGYSGDTLFTHTEEGYSANYEESQAILEYLFPKDKNIILMCGGGGYAGMTKAMLTELGWDENRIYNAGGYWFYEGEHNLQIKHEENGSTYYDFYRVPYHFIDFSVLHRIGEEQSSGDKEPEESSSSVLTQIDKETLKEKISSGDTFAVLFTLPGCGSCAKFQPVISEYAEAGLIDICSFSMQDADLSDTVLKDQVKYTPAVVIFENGEIKGVLSPDSDEDIPYYENVDNLSSWFHDKIGTEIISGEVEAEQEECETGCKVEIGGN